VTQYCCHYGRGRGGGGSRCGNIVVVVVTAACTDVSMGRGGVWGCMTLSLPAFAVAMEKGPSFVGRVVYVNGQR
jgi:hypothetical protein